MKPVRVQLRRTKGWRMPENTVKCDRSTKWGNPFRAGVHHDHQHAVDLFRMLVTQPASLRPHNHLRILLDMDGRGEAYVAELVASIPDLRGKNLACWCAPSSPCHTEVLLELANAPDQASPAQAAARGRVG